MVRLTLYAGATTIGGNKFLVEDGDTRFLLDFGTDYGVLGQFFEEFVKPRSSRGLLDYLETGLLPPIEGLYREDLAADDAWQRYRGGAVRRPDLGADIPYRSLAGEPIDGLLLSHAHLDHAGQIAFLRGDIPIHCSPLTAAILKANQDSGMSTIEGEVCYWKERHVDEEGMFRSARGQAAERRKFHLTHRPSQPGRFDRFWSGVPSGAAEDGAIALSDGIIGRLRYQAFPLDHSLMGACGYAIETSRGWLVYSGDIRKHGGSRQRTLDFVQQASLLKPAVLLCEGTNAGEEHRVTEEEVAERSAAAVRNAAGQLVIADFGPRNVERLLIFLEIAKLSRRSLVILPKDAYLLDAMACSSDDVPPLESRTDVLLYRKARLAPKKWEREILERFPRTIDPAQVHADPGRFILCFSFWDMPELVDINPQGGLYIYSSSEAFNEEMEIDVMRLRAWLDHFGIRAVGLGYRKDGRWVVPDGEGGYHASGHASGPDLLDVVRGISPKVLVPIHTLKRSYYVDNLKGSSIDVQLPTPGQPVDMNQAG